MKKTFAILTALFIGANAFAQAPENESMFFNHLSVGVGILGTDGNSIVVAAPINNYLQLRAGFTTHTGTFAIGDAIVKKYVDDIDGIRPFKKTIDANYDKNGLKIDNLAFEGNIQSHNLELLCDLYPGPKTGFHFTVGAYFNLVPDGLVQMTATPSRKDGQSCYPDAPNKSQIYGITADPNGAFHVNLQYANKVIRPYAGIGFGRPVSMKHRVGVNFDMGVAYLGGAKVVSYNYFDDPANPETVEVDEAFIDKVIADFPDMEKDAESIKDYIKKADEFPYALATKFYPVVKLSIFVRLF